MESERDPSPSSGGPGHERGDGERPADLVLEGGGVRGIALAAAVATLADEGYAFRRVAGTSAGAIVGSILAAITQAGEPVAKLVDITKTLDYRNFQDRGRLGRVADRVGIGGAATVLGVLLHSGMYRGRYLRDWVAGVLAEYDVRTFGDLALPDDPEGDLPEGQRYRLVTVVSDLTQRRMIRLPWDYRDYGLDPDEQSVADAVRASAAIPYYFRPSVLKAASGKATLVDGGMLSNFPITIFDRTDGTRPRWPTFGVDLGASEKPQPMREVTGPISLGFAAIETMLGAHDALNIADPCNAARTIPVDTGSISGVDFDQAKEQEPQLLRAGEDAAREFLRNWDFQRWLDDCRAG